MRIDDGTDAYFGFKLPQLFIIHNISRFDLQVSLNFDHFSYELNVTYSTKKNVTIILSVIVHILMANPIKKNKNKLNNGYYYERHNVYN